MRLLRQHRCKGPSHDDRHIACAVIDRPAYGAVSAISRMRLLRPMCNADSEEIPGRRLATTNVDLDLVCLGIESPFHMACWLLLWNSRPPVPAVYYIVPDPGARRTGSSRNHDHAFPLFSGTEPWFVALHRVLRFEERRAAARRRNLKLKHDQISKSQNVQRIKSIEIRPSLISPDEIIIACVSTCM
jgi:hypothetical protein